MNRRDDKQSRDERLAAKLRENLRRRKAQSRAMGPRALVEDKPPLSKPGSDG